MGITDDRHIFLLLTPRASHFPAQLPPRDDSGFAWQPWCRCVPLHAPCFFGCAMGIPLFPRRHAGSGVFLALGAGAGCLYGSRALSSPGTAYSHHICSLHLQAASAALGMNSVVSLLSGFINSHLVSSFRSNLSFRQLLRAVCVCPAARGYVCLPICPCHAGPLVQPSSFGVLLAPKLLGGVFCIGWS